MNNFKRYKYPIIFTLLSFVILISFQHCGKAKDSDGANSSSLSSPLRANYSENCLPRYGHKNAQIRIKCNVPKSKIYIGAQVVINNKECTNVLHVGETIFFCDVPTSQDLGVFDIVITNPNGTKVSIDNGFGYHSCYDNLTNQPDSFFNIYFANQIMLDSSFCGVPPYYYQKISGSGNLDRNVPMFTSSGFEGETVVRQEDSVGNFHFYNITNTAPPLYVINNFLSVYSGQSFNILASGGIPPYTYSIDASIGQVQSDGKITLVPYLAQGLYSGVIKDTKGSTTSFNFNVQVLSITPANLNMSTGFTHQFIASGGKPPYTFSMDSITNNTISSNGIFSATEVGTFIIKATDSNNVRNKFSVVVNQPLVPSQNTVVTNVENIYKFVIDGGVKPYKFSIANASLGQIDQNGNFNSNVPGVSTVIVEDSYKSSISIPVTIESVIRVNYLSLMPEYGSQQITINGGLPPYSFDIISGIGHFVNNNTLTSDNEGLEDTVVKVTDSLGYFKSFSINKSKSSPLSISQNTVAIVINTQYQFIINGGTRPYRFSIPSGSIGQIDENGVFRSEVPGNSKVVVEDSFQNTLNIFITVQPNLQINYNGSMPSIGNQQFSTTGGMAPYSYQIIQGRDYVTSAGLFTSEWSIQPSTVRVIDALGNSKDFTIVKYASRFEDNFRSPPSPGIDVNGNIILEINSAPASTLIINKFGEKITTRGITKRRSTIFPQSNSWDAACLTHGITRSVSSMSSLYNSYVASEYICANMYQGRYQNQLLNYEFKITNTSNLVSFILPLPDPRELGNNHYQAIVVDDEDNIYVFAAYLGRYNSPDNPWEGKTLIWKFDSNGIQQ
jgi:hypothetical protein